METGDESFEASLEGFASVVASLILFSNVFRDEFIRLDRRAKGKGVEEKLVV